MAEVAGEDTGHGETPRLASSPTAGWYATDSLIKNKKISESVTIQQPQGCCEYINIK